MATWSERDQEVLWHPYTQMKTAPPPVTIVRGEGAYLITEDGRRLFDGISSWWTSLHGHAHPAIAERVARQARELEHVIFAGFTHKPAVELAERLLQLLQKNQKRVFFSDNGSTAVEVALKMAIQYWSNQGQPKRRRVIAFEGGYHGDTFGAMSVSERGPFTQPFESFLFKTDRIPFPEPGRERESELALEALLSEGDGAALIVEPLVQGTAGMRICSPEALETLFKLAHRHGALVIADEVMTGFYRTGRAFACHAFGEAPDLVCLSKGLTGGTMALGATTCSQKIFESFLSEDRSKTFFHGHSFTANPLACAAALGSLDLLAQPGTLGQIEQITSQHRKFVQELKESPIAREKLRNPRSLGTLFAVDFPGKGYLDPLGPKLGRFFLERDLLLRPLGSTLYVLPPYCTASPDLQRIYKAIIEATEKVL